MRDKIVFVVSFGGHGDIRRVMRYITTGDAPQVPGITVAHPPHDYALAVVLFGLADRGVVPADQVTLLRDGIETFLLASQQTLVDTALANATFSQARDMQKAMPEPAATFMRYVNDRSVANWADAGAVPDAERRRDPRPLSAAPPIGRAPRSTCCTVTATRSFRRPSRACSPTTCGHAASTST